MDTVESAGRLFHGELVRKVTCILFVLIALAASVAPPAHANANSANQTVQKNAKRRAKNDARQRKKDQKAAQKATKDWKKHHPTGY